MSQYSQDRLESRIEQAINTMIVQREIKNPKLGQFVSVTRVSLSKDNAYATAYVSCLVQDNNNLQRSVDALQRSAGFIQSRLGAVLRTRNTPQLRFEPDTSIFEAHEVNRLIDSLNPEKQ
ncbi:MAG: 30S ribosome-binding factor RbfA [Spirochaetales bacterium]|nr:30S ribosome-binding factor RbfA [Spirochaetales bacterium]